MSMAIIAQIEANTANGGSAQGFLTGSDTTSAASTFYGRRLTTMLVNESFSGTPTVNTFTASTGGGGVVSTEGTFTLVPGDYRISIFAKYFVNSAGSVMAGLYNITSAAFEVYSGTAEPVLLESTGTALAIDYDLRVLEAKITVASSNKTFSIRHEASTTTIARDNQLCGIPTAMTATNVNGAAARNTFCGIKIVRTS